MLLLFSLSLFVVVTVVEKVFVITLTIFLLKRRKLLTIRRQKIKEEEKSARVSVKRDEICITVKAI